jgi:hypothetical protein
MRDDPMTSAKQKDRTISVRGKKQTGAAGLFILVTPRPQKGQIDSVSGRAT